MADYHPLIARAVAGLDKNTGENRRALYERARTALVAQLRGVQPALDESEITRERLALEEAIRKVEAESARLARETARTTTAKRATESPPRAEMAPRPPADELPTPRVRVNRSLSDSALRNFRDGVADAPPLPEPPDRTPADVSHSLREYGQLEPGMQNEAMFAQDQQQQQPAAFDLDDRPASMRMRAPREDEELPPEEAPPPPRSYRGILRVVVISALIGVLAALLYWQRDTIGGVASGVASLFRSSPSTPAPPRETATPARPKIPDRIGTPAAPQPGGPQVAQRVVLYEEDPDDPQGKRFVGTVLWRAETMSVAQGRAPEFVVRADVNIPERQMSLTWSLRRNTDQSLPASHTIEIMFNLPPDSPSGGVQNVPGVLMKQSEQTRGVPLAGLAVKVTPGFFLIGLSAVEADMLRNVQLLKERSWFDVPIVYNNGRRAILAMEKGNPGEKALNDAFAAWRQ